MTPSEGDLSGFSLFDLFKAEVEGHTASLEKGLIELGTQGPAPERLEGLMRAAHSLKGAARIVGVEAGVKVAHAMEDAFVAAQKGMASIGDDGIDLLLTAVDVLRTLGAGDGDAAVRYMEERRSDVEGLVGRLRGLASGAAASPPPRAAPAPKPAVAAPAPTPPPAPTTAPASAPQPKAPLAPAGAPATPGEEEAAVRVSAAGLARMLAYAGESVVDARRLASLSSADERLRRDLARTADLVERLVSERAGGAANGVRDALLSLRQQVAELRRRAAERTEGLQEAVRRGEDLSGRLYREVLASRMRPFGEGVSGIPRLVRSVSRELGKKVRFELRGEGVPVDRDILDRLDAPLGHLVRNAIDHGVEAPETRAAAGKEPTARVVLEARHRGGMLEVEVSDDGRGVDPEVIRAKVVERGLIRADVARDLSPAEVLEFLFLPGFSTKTEVSELSGRGVGLDVVQTMAREAGGHARISSEKGRGTKLVLVLPVTRSVIRAALVEIGGEPYACPLTQVERLVSVEASEIGEAEGRQRFAYEGKAVGLIPAAEVLGVPRAPRAPGPVCVVLLASGEDLYGIAVDRFLGEQDLVVRPLDPRLGKVPNLSAASLDDDGRPVLILDPQDLVRSIDLLLHEGRLRTVRVTGGDRATRGARRRRILVVDDSITVRELERKLLSARGFQVDTAVDGMDAWNSLRSHAYDLVISDVDMPRMDGIALVRKIRQEPRLERLPVMIVSYKEREEDRMRGLEAGANAYLTKSSFQDEAWLAAVEDLVGEPES
jgi:two-component system sensor histidine kinase and response regulator WspE